MKKLIVALAALAATAGNLQAGSIDRNFLDTAVLFEKGNVLKFGAYHASPSLKGRFPAALGGGSTGDGGDSFQNYNASIKYQVNDRISLALLFDQPYGADIAFGGSFYNGLAADWETKAITAIGRYKFANNVSVYAGPRLLRTDASIFVPQSTYEKPEIALRVSLTYQSAVDQKVGVAEAFNPPVLPPAVTRTEVELPQVVQFDFQTGIAPKTLLFGMVRWSDWSEFGVRTQQFGLITGQKVADVLDDIWTVRLGVGRQITDKLSGFVRATWEPQNNSTLSRVAPTDGRFAVGLGGSYNFGRAKLTVGGEYIDLGGGTDGVANFKNNEAYILASSIQFTF
ncbi:MAG: hypothetical protein CVT80_08325 [Alphaproteobacteria bacterium HGW-Alphaproteobacteria-2]|nr:MAG: hypothetical protein CVT80_08325 [Alphaproteobacteria bacterium HGW-Alphaproteobacteria-2]